MEILSPAKLKFNSKVFKITISIRIRTEVFRWRNKTLFIRSRPEMEFYMYYVKFVRCQDANVAGKVFNFYFIYQNLSGSLSKQTLFIYVNF